MSTTINNPPAIPTQQTVRQIKRDGLVNVMSGLGTSRSKRSHNEFQFGSLNNWQQLEAAYQTNWIAAKIVDIPAEDMTREWRRIKCDGAENIVTVENQFKLQLKVQEALTWGRLYGGAGILMITDQDLEKPLNVNALKKGSLKQLVVVDRWDLHSLMVNNFDILSENYLNPEFFTLRHGAQRIHHSHIAKFKGRKLPRRWQEKLQGWGDSYLRKCIDDVMDMVAAKDGIAELMQEANIDVITSEGLADDLATDQDEKIVKRYELFNQMKSIINMALLDEGETIDRHTLNLSGVAPIIEQFITFISAAADIPVTRMFGTSAKGMNATGEGDDRNYNNSIRAGQIAQLSEPLSTLDEVIVRSALGELPDDYSYVWNPLQQPNQLEAAQARQLNSQTHVSYLTEGIVQPSQVMRELQANEDYQFDEDFLDELEEMEQSNEFSDVPNPDERDDVELSKQEEENPA